MNTPASSLVIVGKISSAYGIKGWVNVQSFTDPITNILIYKPWYLSPRKGKTEWEPVAIVTGRVQGDHIVAQLKGCVDRNTAELYRGLDIAVHRNQLPPPDDDEHYWVDLVGLRVETLKGEQLGIVDGFMETGANDVMVVKGDRERLIPFVKEQFIHKIDIESGTITVDWDPDF